MKKLQVLDLHVDRIENEDEFCKILRNAACLRDFQFSAGRNVELNYAQNFVREVFESVSGLKELHKVELCVKVENGHDKALLHAALNSAQVFRLRRINVHENDKHFS